MVFSSLLGARITDDVILEQLMDGNLSEIEDFDEDDFAFAPNTLFDQLACEDVSDGDNPNEDEEISHPTSPLICPPVVEPQYTSTPRPPASLMTQHTPPPMMQSPSKVQPSCPSSTSRRSAHRDRSVLSSCRSTTRARGRGSASTRISRRRIWKQVPFVDKLHNYLPLPTKTVRRPIEYFRDYIANDFTERISHCTNLYYLRTTGRELKSTSSEIAKLIAIEIFMGCIPIPGCLCIGGLVLGWKSSPV